MKGGSCFFGANGNPIDGTNPCPGVSVLSTKEVTPYDPNTSVYYIISHGCDMINDIQEVPADCIYITRALCGVETTMALEGYKRFLEDFSKGEERLKDPKTNRAKVSNYYKPTNQNKINFENYRSEKITLHYPESKHHNTFVNNKLTCTFEGFYIAGLYRIGSPIYENEYIKPIEIDENTTVEEVILQMYEESLYPTKSDIQTLLQDILTPDERSVKIQPLKMGAKLGIINPIKEKIKEKFTIDAATLMKKFPGVFYMFSCRPICRGEDTRTELNNETANQRIVMRRTVSALPNTPGVLGGSRKRINKRRKTRKQKKSF